MKTAQLGSRGLLVRPGHGLVTKAWLVQSPCSMKNAGKVVGHIIPSLKEWCVCMCVKIMLKAETKFPSKELKSKYFTYTTDDGEMGLQVFLD